MNIERVNSELKRQIAVIIDGEIKDPRLKGITSITSIETAKDLGSATVYISVLGGDVKETLTVLKGSAGFIRSLVKDRVKIRNVPELRFKADSSIEYGIRMDKLIGEIVKKKEE